MKCHGTTHDDHEPIEMNTDVQAVDYAEHECPVCGATVSIELDVDYDRPLLRGP